MWGGPPGVSGPVSGWGCQGEEGLGQSPASLLGRGLPLCPRHSPRPCKGPQPACHTCNARVHAGARWEAGRHSVLSKGCSRSLGAEESKKCRLIASGRKENTAKASQAERLSSAKPLLCWACVLPGQRRLGGQQPWFPSPLSFNQPPDKDQGFKRP